MPSWAKVAPEQIAEAKKHGVPVAFENDLGMRFVLIPAGTFMMGSPLSEKRELVPAHGYIDEYPQHRVTLSQPFYVSIYEVTNEQYRRWRAQHDSGEYKGHSLNGDAQPVAKVSHTDAEGYAAWLSSRDGQRVYELPTEAQWEYACRAGTTTRYWWGSAEADAHKKANVWDGETKDVFGGLWDSFPGDDDYRAAASVGSFQPNHWGLYDTHGNVWEWCADWYEREYTPEPVTDPVGPASGEFRCNRGGSWNYSPRLGRSADRSGDEPDAIRMDTGFRLIVRVPHGSK